MILKTFFLVFAVIVFALVLVLFYGDTNWNAQTAQLLNRLDAAQVKAQPQFFNAKELEGLPAPVKRYFETVLKDG